MKSKFENALKGLRVVQTGIKASSDTEPTLSLLTIPNKFQLNRLATALMGLKVGNRVRIIAGSSDDINTKFYLAKTSDTDVTGAKISKANSANPAKEGIDMTFNYSGVWSQLLQGEADAVELGYEAMIAKDLVVMGETKGGGNIRYRATKDVKLTLEDVGEHEIDEVTYHLFALTDYTSTDKLEDEATDQPVKNTPSTESEEEEEEVEEEDEE